MTDPCILNNSSSDAMLGQQLLVTTERAFEQAHDFTIEFAEFHLNTYQGWHTNDLEAIRKWLNAPDPSSNFNSAIRKKTPGTGKWILEHETYLKWKKSGGRLWMQGKVGTGKTVLLAAIVKDLQPNINYFYFDRRDNTKMKTTYHGFLVSLLVQVASNHEGVHPQLQELYSKCKKGLYQPETEDLEATLMAITQESVTFIAIDAMDECDEPDLVINLLLDLPSSCYIIVTSRFNSSTSAAWFIIKLVNGAVSSDIEQYINNQLNNWKLSPRLHDEILNSLLSGAQGQFRWVDCQVRSLQALNTPRLIRNALTRLPKDLDETYLEILQKIDKACYDSACSIFMWLLYAYEPLNLDQVADILAVDLEAKTFDLDDRPLELQNGLHRIVDSTFVVINSLWGKNVVQFAHISVKEFLISAHGMAIGMNLFKINKELGHELIAQACIIYLLQFNSWESYDFKMYPLATYAAQRWTRHCDELPFIGNKIAQLRRILFQEHNPQYLNWLRLHRVDEIFWNQRKQPSLTLNEIQKPLYYAAYLGWLDVVHEITGEVVQTAAASCITVPAFIEPNSGVVLAKSSTQKRMDQHSLQDGAKIVEHMKQSKVDINIQGMRYGTALQAAAFMGHQAVVEYLLQLGADINIQAGEYGTALQAAIANNKKSVVECLIQAGADVHAKGGKDGNALLSAIIRGSKELVGCLLQAGADANAQGGKDGNALLSAIFRGDKEIVEWLLKAGADVNAQGGEYGPALQAAAFKGQREIVECLLEAEANMNVEGGIYKTALQAAASMGHKATVQCLLQAGADVNMQGGVYGNALQAAAASRGHKKTVECLLQAGADVNAQGGQYGNALQAAASWGHKETVKCLLQAGANVNGGEYGNALQAAAYWGHKETVKCLLQAGADVNAQGEREYGNALQAAAYWGDKEIVECLLQAGADVNAQGGKDGNALLIAISRGDKEIVQCLLEAGADANMQGGKDGNALLSAIFRNDKEIVEWLLQAGADVNAQGGQYGNALQAAASCSHKETVECLLQAGANVNVQGGRE